MRGVSDSNFGFLLALLFVALTSATAEAADQGPAVLDWADGVHGPCPTRLTVPGASASSATVVFDFAPTEFVEFVVCDPLLPAVNPPFHEEQLVVVPGSQCAPNLASGAFADTLTFSSAAYGFTATLTMFHTAEGFDLVVAATSTSNRYSLFEIRAPRLKIVPHGVSAVDDYAFHGYFSGAVMKEPRRSRWRAPNPPTAANKPNFEIPLNGAGMAVVSYWDAEDGSQIMVRFDDENALEKRLRIESDDVHALFSFTHAPRNGRTPGNVFDHGYRTVVTAFRGEGPDYRLGVYDTIERYREFAAAPTRPWRSRQPWSSPQSQGAVPPAYSPRMRDAELFAYQMSSPLSSRASELAAVRRLLSSSSGAPVPVVATWWRWYDRPFDTLQPDFPPLAEYLDALAAVTASPGISVAAYDWVGGWDLALRNRPGRYRPEAYVALGLAPGGGACGPFTDLSKPFDLYEYFCQDQFGAPAVAHPNTWTILDQRSPVAALLAHNVLKRHYVEAGPAPPTGWYLDFFSGGGLVPDFRPAPHPLCPGCETGNDGRWAPGKLATAYAAKASIRDCDPNGFLTTELPEEYLIPAFEAMHVYDPENSGYARGRGFWFFPTCHGDVIRTMNITEPAIVDFHLDDPAAIAAGPVLALHLFNLLAASFHATGALSYRNGSSYDLSAFAEAASAPFDVSTLTPAEGLFRAIKTHHGRIDGYREFVGGRRVRALPDGWESSFLASDSDFNSWIAQTQQIRWSSVWRSHAGEIGILVTSTAAVSQPFVVDFDPSLYGLSSTASLVIEQWTAAGWIPAPTTAIAGATAGSAGPQFIGRLVAGLPVPPLGFEVFRIRPLPPP